jgi:hypothetical protein
MESLLIEKTLGRQERYTFLGNREIKFCSWQSVVSFLIVGSSDAQEAGPGDRSATVGLLGTLILEL